ncbi:unnamed protein product [marine sediment metagenome]|uniref:Tripartite ATP-independent periplasmic transporters DctQ component domain-containing protein n=1 Tax=marine sediment metagenome TaxID=412755 RepID=X1VVD1_9ZZZZ
MRIVKLLDKALQGVTNFNVFIEMLAELVACMLATVVIWGVILTYGLGSSDVFSVEISEYCLVFICFTSMAYVLKEDRHVKITVFVDKLSPRLHLVMNIVTSFLTFIFCVIVTWKAAVVMLLNYKRGFLSSSLVNFPMWIPYMIISFGFFLLALQYIVNIRELTSKLKPQPNPQKRVLKKGVM